MSLGIENAISVSAFSVNGVNLSDDGSSVSILRDPAKENAKRGLTDRAHGSGWRMGIAL